MSGLTSFCREPKRYMNSTLKKNETTWIVKQINDIECVVLINQSEDSHCTVVVGNLLVRICCLRFIATQRLTLRLITVAWKITERWFLLSKRFCTEHALMTYRFKLITGKSFPWTCFLSFIIRFSTDNVWVTRTCWGFKNYQFN